MSGRLLPFLVILIQFALLVALVQRWDIEGQSFARVMGLAFGGFVVHHWLPMRFRLPFFAVLSVVATISVLGEVGPKTVVAAVTGEMRLIDVFYKVLPGGLLLGIGMALIGLCHLPIRWGGRVALLLVATAGLSWLRVNTQWLPDVPTAVWVILGSMFIFRMMIYVYDLKHRSAPFSLSRAVAYFFMLPNASFPLFPIVDYKTFCATYYNEEWVRIYQTGLQWMLRGIFQLLLYQFIYQFAPLDATKLSTALDVAVFALSTYLLYLHLSGQFHLIVGLLHMFGFNLPETHHLFLLASSFTDFWRRINIYWKDFIMKLFFYPIFFALRKMGTVLAITLATIAAFFITWLLHSWQWFWIRGSFLLTWQDTSFWAILAVLVLANAIYEAKAKRQRKLSQSSVTLRERFFLGLKTVGTFTVICVLWTYWSCQSLEELKTLIDAASRPTVSELGIILLFLVGMGVAGMFLGTSSRVTSEGRPMLAARPPFHFARIAASIVVGSLALLFAPALAKLGVPGAEAVLARLRHDVLNPRDMQVQRRGYYEVLDMGRANLLRDRGVSAPEGWFSGLDELHRARPDFLMEEVAPSVSAMLGGARATCNRLGMRDRDYREAKQPNTYRLVLLGSSHEFGHGVNDDETFENLVEDRLNREQTNSRRARYEIMNLAHSGDSFLQKLLRLETIGFPYAPDAAIFCVNASESDFLMRHLKQAVGSGVVPPPGYREMLDDITRRAGVTSKMPGLVIERRLRTFDLEILQWSFRRLAEQCAKNGVRPLVTYRAAPTDAQGVEPSRRDEIKKLAQAAGLEFIDLSSAFDAVTDRETLTVAKWDGHTNREGHRLLAEKLYREIVPLLAAAEKPRASAQ